MEGSTVTLLGLVKYDTKNQDFEMTELSAIVAGGVTECQNYIRY
jgi:hypothetical protein